MAYNALAMWTDMADPPQKKKSNTKYIKNGPIFFYKIFSILFFF